MIRLRTSQVELTPTDVAFAVRRIQLQRRSVRVAEGTAALARHNARVAVSSESRDELPLPLPPSGEPSHSRDESIISEEPVIYGQREFWDRIVAEAGPIDDAGIESGDEETTPTSHAQDDSGLADHSGVLPYEPRGEESNQQDANCEAIEKDDCDKSQTGEDMPLRTAAHAFYQRAHGGQYDGICDGASGGSEFCSPSISMSSSNWPHRDAEGGEAGEGDGESCPSSSEFEEDVVSGPEISPHISISGDPQLSQSSQRLGVEEGADLLTLRRSFSAQLNFDGVSESTPRNSPPQLPFPRSPSIRSPLSAPSPASVGERTHLNGSLHTSPLQASPLHTSLRGAAGSGEAAMGLPMWNGSDYGDQGQRYPRGLYVPKTPTHSFRESKLSSRTSYAIPSESAQRLYESVFAHALGDGGRVADDDSQSMVNGIDIAAHETEVISAGGSVQLPSFDSVFSVQGDEVLSPNGPDRSPIRYPQVRASPVMVAPPPSPSQGVIAPHLTIFNDSQVHTAVDRRRPRRGPLRPGQRIPRLMRSTQILRHEDLGHEDTPRQRRGRELGLPEHWIHDGVVAQREFHQWLNMSDIPGLDRSDSSEEL